jgi:hypothetical protein
MNILPDLQVNFKTFSEGRPNTLLQAFYALTTDPTDEPDEPGADDIVWALIPLRASELDRLLALLTGNDDL